jgi:hypothetical protein
MAGSAGGPGSRVGRYTGLAGGAAAAGALAYIGLADPHRPDAWFPPCPFKLLTGWDCPGCGGLRMTHDLLHGDLGGALADNAFVVVGTPVLGLWWLWRRREGRPVLTPAALVAVLVAAVAWTVLRNTADFPFGAA